LVQETWELLSRPDPAGKTKPVQLEPTSMLLGGRPFWVSLIVCLAIETAGAKPVQDLCALIAGKTWILPKEARDCMTSIPLNASIKNNVSHIFIK
jgi:hypothetical protein